MPLSLPDFPWDELDQAKSVAASHPEGLIDLSVGSPVDPTPEFIQRALGAAANAPGYPTVVGGASTREALALWWQSQRGASSIQSESVIPTIGSKEMVGLLPLLLGLGPTDTVVIPKIAYPTYEIGATLVRATVVVEDDPTRWPEGTSLIWLNSPSNPTGVVAGVERLRACLAAARRLGALVVNDECYAMLGSVDAPTSPSILSDEVTGGDLSAVLALYSLSKQSHLAGYRAAMIAGDPGLIERIVLPRRHLGLIVPAPVQEAMVAALGESDHVEQARGRYQARRATIAPALYAAGWTNEGGDAGLYLWMRHPEYGESGVDWFADRGILVAPGHFYGKAGEGHVRIALTAPDAEIQAAAGRIRS